MTKKNVTPILNQLKKLNVQGNVQLWELSPYFLELLPTYHTF
jgi:hypothetical protein